jgi:predicted permease
MSLRDAIVGDVRLPIVVATVSVTLVLVVMAANVAGLFLAGGLARRRELAVRAALGADRARLIRQLGCEVMIVTLAGGAAGIATAALVTGPLVSAYPGLLPRASAVAFDGRAALVMAMLTVVSGLAIAIVPAWRLTGRQLSSALGAGDRSGVFAARRPQQALVAAELALSVAVTIGALLLVQSLGHLLSEPLGFQPRDVLTATVSTGGDEARATTFFRELRDRVGQQPGVLEAGVISSVPLVNRAPPDTFMIDGRPVPGPSEPGPIAHYIVAGPGALDALGIPLRRGRSIGRDDVAAGAPVAVINEALAARYWPGEHAIGRRVRYPTGIADGRWSSWTPWITIVGVVDDVRSIAPAVPGEPAIYVSYAQRPRAAYSGTSMRLVVRATAPAALAATLRETARAIDPRAVVEPVVPLDGFLRAALARPRFLSGLLGSFAVVTVAIAVVGIFALASYLVASRRREFGVRLALGATRAGVFALVIRQLALAMAAAAPAGLAAAWLLARWMQSLLHGIGPWDLWTYGGASIALSMVVLAATAIPARRAMRVDPLTSLRAE